jgi:ribosomal protein L19
VRSLRKLIEKRRKRIESYKGYVLFKQDGSTKPITDSILERKAMAKEANIFRDSRHKKIA